MRLKSARVQKYRSIRDTGWFPIEPGKLVFIGANKARRSAIHEALQKINRPASAAGFDALRDYPRSEYNDITTGVVKPNDVEVVSVMFSLGKEDLDRLPDGYEDAVYVVSTRLDNVPVHRIEGGPARAVINTGLREDLTRLAAHADGQYVGEPGGAPSKTAAAVSAGWKDSCYLTEAQGTELRKWLDVLMTLVDEANETEVERYDRLVESSDRPAAHADALKTLHERIPVFMFFDNYFRLRPLIQLELLVRRARFIGSNQNHVAKKVRLSYIKEHAQIRKSIDRDAREEEAGETSAVNRSKRCPTTRPDNNQLSNRWQKRISKNWRPMMFFLILFLALTAGFWYKFNSDSGEEPTTFKNYAPQYLNVFFTQAQLEQDPTVHISVDLQPANYDNPLDPNPPVKVSASGPSALDELVTIELDSRNPIPQGAVAIVSSNEPAENNYIKDQSSRDFVSIESLGSARKKSNGQFESEANSAFDAVPIFWDSDGSIYGHLPSIDITPWANGNIPDVQAEFTKNDDRIIKGHVDFGGEPPDSPPIFHAASHADDAESFWETSDFSVTEEIEHAGPALSNDQVDYMNPPPAASTDNYQWNFTGCCSLEPIFKLTDPEATDSQNKNAFVSGIAFGVAGAAAIAVIQELPKELRMSRRRRQSKSTDSEAPSPGAALKELDSPSDRGDAAAT